MAEITTLRKRITNKYVSRYDYLDQWEDLGQLTILNRADQREDDEDPDDCMVHFFLLKVELEKELSDEDVARAIYDTLSYGGCACAHDCCGCRSMSINHAEKSDIFNFGHRDADYQIWMAVGNSSCNY